MARDFELGSTEKVNRATHATESETNISFGAWVNIESTGTTKAVIYNGFGGGSGRAFGMRIGNGNPPILNLDISFVAAINSSGTISVGDWHHVMVTRDTTTWRLYIDGGADGTGTSNPFDISGDGTADTTIGARKTDSGGFDNHFDGLIAEAAWWERELTPDEVGALADGFSPWFFRRSLLWYKPFLKDDATWDAVDSASEWAATGTTNAIHPRIIYPSPAQMRRFTTAAAPATAIKDILSIGLIPFPR